MFYLQLGPDDPTSFLKAKCKKIAQWFFEQSVNM